jgi:hypothetical protein
MSARKSIRGGESQAASRGQLRLLEPNDITDAMIDAALHVWFRQSDRRYVAGLIENESYRRDMRDAIYAALQVGGQ